MPLLDGLFYSSRVDSLFCDSASVQSLLDFESALARAEAQAGVIPTSAASAIASQCRAELFDLAALAAAVPASGNLAIPLVKQLTQLVAKQNSEAARFVHWGATSQDAIDTALILQLRAASKLILADLDSLCDSLASIADSHRLTPVAARTWLQQALPTSFGYIVAGWLDALLRHRARIIALNSNAFVLQFGGAVGTLAALGDRGIVVAKNLAQELSLPLPTMPWHSHRDRIAEIATTFGLLTATLSKIAADLTLHMQTEVAEISEPYASGRGGSSTMPHKQNPVSCAAILAASSRVPALVTSFLSAAPPQHQRGLGSWHAEWQTLPEITRLAAGALHHLSALAPRLQINTARMRENLNLTRGLIFAEAVSMALAEKIGRAAAHEQIESACLAATQSDRHLRDALASNPAISSHLSLADLSRLFDPTNYLGSSSAFIDTILAANNARKSAHHHSA